MSTYNTVMLPSCKEVLAKVSQGGVEASPMRYSNWTQARKKAQELGESWSAWKGVGQAIYIVRI